MAGYVCTKVYRKLKSSGCRDLYQGIEDMVEESDDDSDTSSTWLDLVDRGGLFRVSNEAFAFFISIEQVIRHHLQTKKIKALGEGKREEIVRNIVENDEVKLNWTLVGIELSEGERSTLLQLFATEWTTLRGFSFVGSFMELYKQASRKSLQKSKGLRTKLNTAEAAKGEDNQ